MMLLTLRGTPVLYYGDELGMPDTAVPTERLLDPVTIAFDRIIDRDAARTPMPWSARPGGDFTVPGVEPWLPFGDLAACNVADQRADPGSVLHLVRALLALRRATPDLRVGAYVDLGVDGPVWSFRRGDDVQVVLNFGDEPVIVPVALDDARVVISTDRVGEGALVAGSVGGSVEVEGRRGVVLVAAVRGEAVGGEAGN